jgi:hypothetical protein
MIPSSQRAKKNQPRLLGFAAGSLKVLCFSLGLQHVVFKLRRSALLKKEEAVGKGEKEKCTSATHDLGYYRRLKNGCQDFISTQKAQDKTHKRHKKLGQKKCLCPFVDLSCAFCVLREKQ